MLSHRDLGEIPEAFLAERILTAPSGFSGFERLRFRPKPVSAVS